MLGQVKAYSYKKPKHFIVKLIKSENYTCSLQICIHLSVIKSKHHHKMKMYWSFCMMAYISRYTQLKMLNTKYVDSHMVDPGEEGVGQDFLEPPLCSHFLSSKSPFLLHNGIKINSLSLKCGSVPGTDHPSSH